MKLDYSLIELEQDDKDMLSDIIFDAVGVTKLKDEILIAFWHNLPNDIKLDALKWGMNDTVVREAIYKCIIDHKEK